MRDALRTPALWILLILFSVLLFATNMLTTHQVAYLRDLQYSPMVSATALGLMLGMSILGRLFSGILGMRFDGRYLAAVFLACMGLGIVSLMNARGDLFCLSLFDPNRHWIWRDDRAFAQHHGRLLRTHALFPDCRLDDPRGNAGQRRQSNACRISL